MIGVLALQGAFREHICMLKNIGAKTCEVKYASQFDNIDALIIPGGESSVIGLIAKNNELIQAIQEFHKRGKPIWGTCAGMIFLSKDIYECPEQPTLGLINCQVKRNHYGSQKHSSIVELSFPDTIGKGTFKAVLIRAPIIKKIYDDSEILVSYNDDILAIRNKNILCTSFHPELTSDPAWHQYFLSFL